MNHIWLNLLINENKIIFINNNNIKINMLSLKSLIKIILHYIFIIIFLNKKFLFVNAQSDQDKALCGLIAATDVQSIKSQWSCNSTGFTSTNPCSPVWSTLICSGNVITSMEWFGVSGRGNKFCSINIVQSNISYTTF